MKFKEQALQELGEISQFMSFSNAVYENSQNYIKNLANDHEHMKVNEFVDMCVELARIDREDLNK